MSAGKLFQMAVDYLIIYLRITAEDERDRLDQVLEPAAVHRQRCRRTAGDRLAYCHVRCRTTSVRLRKTPHRWNVRRKPGTLPVSIRHTG